MKFLKKFLLFCLGGGLYMLLELLWRGWSHVSMFLLGGGCFLALGRLSRSRVPVAVLPLAGAALITAGELLTGLLVNRQYTVWDYRDMRFQFLGQICLPFSLLWMPLSLAAMGLYRLADRWLLRRVEG